MSINSISSSSYFKFDSHDGDSLPKRFRQVELHREEGLAVHGISGSGQFSKDTFLLLKKTIGHENAVIIDAREETHLHDQEGRAVSLRADHNFLNKGKKLHEIVAIEDEYVKQTSEGRTFDMYNVADQTGTDTNFKVTLFGTEEQLIKDNAPQYAYHRLPITDGHLASDEIIDQVVDIKQAAKRDRKWIHVHCCLGRGRTSTILTLLYILEHANKKSLPEIFDTLEALGNIVLRKTSSRKSEEENRRGDPFFWELFHKYSCQEGWKNSNWSEWRQNQPAQLQETAPKPVKKQKTKNAKTITRTLDVEALKEHKLTMENGTLSTTRLGTLPTNGVFNALFEDGSVYVLSDEDKKNNPFVNTKMKIKLDGKRISNVVFKSPLMDASEKEKQYQFLTALQNLGTDLSTVIVRVNAGADHQKSKQPAAHWLKEIQSKNS